jgi:hypothetical protein
MNARIALTATAVAAVLMTTSSAFAQTTEYTFRDGLSGYAGTQDTELRSNTGDTGTPTGGNDSISVDGDDGSPGLKPNQGLIRFGSIFGAGGIQATDTIVSAKLMLNVTNPGSGFTVHDMLVDWSEATATWDSLAGGVQANGIEAASAQIATFGTNNGSENVPVGMLVIDVTTSLQAVKAGALPGYGWALLPYANGTNGVDFDASESFSSALRPTLAVEVMPVPEPGTWALMAAGLGLLGLAGRRTRR